MTARLSTMAHAHPLATFFALAFALSWWPWLVYATVPGVPLFAVFLAMVPGPALAAVVVTALAKGRAGVRALLGRLLRWRVAPRWYAVALLLPLVIRLAAVGINVLLGAPMPTGAQFGAWSRLVLLFPLILLVPGFGGAWEELGWRGLALPRLQARHSALVASLLLGAVHAIWHLPLALAGEFAWPDLLDTLVFAVIVTWVFNNARGSVLLTMLFHAANNTASKFVSPMFAGADATRLSLLFTAVAAAVALAVVLQAGRDLARTPAAPAEPLGRSAAAG
jgi:membrane protease YdiL (CAAX protease family)